MHDIPLNFYVATSLGYILNNYNKNSNVLMLKNSNPFVSKHVCVFSHIWCDLCIISGAGRERASVEYEAARDNLLDSVLDMTPALGPQCVIDLMYVLCLARCFSFSLLLWVPRD